MDVGVSDSMCVVQGDAVCCCVSGGCLFINLNGHSPQKWNSITSSIRVIYLYVYRVGHSSQFPGWWRNCMRKTFGIVAFSRMASLQCASSDTTACRRHGRAPLNENGWARSWWLSISVCMNLLYCVSAIFHSLPANKNPTLRARLVFTKRWICDLWWRRSDVETVTLISIHTAIKKQSWSEPKRLHGG